MPVPETPGQYIRRCRLDAQMTPEDVAIRVDSMPPVGTKRRAEMVTDLELDLTKVRLSTARALARIPELRIDLDLLGDLADRYDEKRLGGRLPRLMPVPTLRERD